MDSLETDFVQAREASFFSGRDGYAQLDYQIYDDATAVTKKTFLFDNVPQYVFTIYLARGPAVFAFDFWADEDWRKLTTSLILMSLIPLITTATRRLSCRSIISFTLITDPNGLFQFEVPSAWTYSYDEGGECITSILLLLQICIQRWRTSLMMMARPGPNLRPER